VNQSKTENDKHIRLELVILMETEKQ